MQQPQQAKPQAGGIPMSPAQEMAVKQMGTQQQPFGWLMDMIQHITGTMGQGTIPQPQGQAPQGKPMDEKMPPGQGKQSDAGQPPAQSGQPGQPQPGGMIDPASVQMLTSLFQPNPLSNLGLLPQQQGSWNWVLAQMQQGMAGKAQANAGKGGDLVSLLREIGPALAGGPSGAAASGASKGGSGTPKASGGSSGSKG